MNAACRIPHTAIQASAGSGKTYQLAHRYIRLLAGGVAPDTIVALTFSRKAAGEILSDITKYLCEAAGSAEAAARHSKDAGDSGTTEAQYLACLRAVADSLHRLHIGTLDSFIVGILRSFALELGLGAGVQIMNDDGPDAGEMLRKIFASVFAAPDLDDKTHRQFREAIRQATFGREEKRLGDILDSVLRGFWPYLREAPDAGSWGNAGRIWSIPPPWQPAPAAEARRAAESLRASIREARWDERLKKALLVFVDFVAGYGPLSRWDDRAIGSSAMKQVVAAVRDGAAGSLDLEYYRKTYTLDAAQTEELRLLVCHLFGVELHRALEQTKGLHTFVSLFDDFYDRLARRRGTLTFQDAQYLLSPANVLTQGATLSRDSTALLYVDYRLDCRLNHWLLDEFQDTSNLQWAVLSNLAHEILQDSTGERSFFYVGDVKQSIYGWRGGNPRLFDEVRAPYPKEWIALDRRSVSYRSCAAVISAVNRAFARLPEAIPAAVSDRWHAAWENHAIAPRREPLDGVAAVIEPTAADGSEKPTDDDRYRVAARLLQEIDPLGRGLTVAALVRSNAAGKTLANALRRECPGRMIVHEGPASIQDNPVVALLLSLIKFAAHPADRFAWRHLQMSPLWRAFQRLGLDRASLSLVLLRQIHQDGLEEIVRRWGDELVRETALSVFETKRLADLVAAAASFDQRGVRDADAFIRFMDQYEINEPAAENAVRVMTVHQAKGLEFDLVILPDLQPSRGGDMRQSGKNVLVGQAADKERSAWVLVPPRKAVVDSDPMLSAVVERDDADACYEELCVLYVAMTRARKGLYVITSYPGKTSETFTPAAFLKTQLAGDPKPDGGEDIQVAGETVRRLFIEGNWDWFKTETGGAAEQPAEAAAVWPEDFAGRESRRKTLNRIEPSGREACERKAAWFFSPEARDVLDFGSAIHELFQAVTWTGESDAEAAIAEWRGGAAYAPAVTRDATEQFRQALRSPDVREAMSRPAGEVELWREKRFDLVMGRDWVSGMFDRVTIERDARGRVVRAGILDYKSDRIKTDADIQRAVETYRGQMDLYRTALQRILGCKATQIAVRLLFTRVGRVVSV